MPITRLNLLYHLTPLAANELWRFHCSRLSPLAPRFNGRVVIAVAQGDGLIPVDQVRPLLPAVEVLTVLNHPEQRETVSLEALLQRVRSTDADEASCYAHSKGVTQPHLKPVQWWAEALYARCAAAGEQAAKALERHPCTGVFKRRGRWSHFPAWCDWHYSGTFFWFRHDALFSRDWQAIDASRYGTEAYLSRFFDAASAHCLFGDDAGDLYKPRTWRMPPLAPGTPHAA